MDSSELYDRFRSDVVDEAKPYLWSDAEVFGYMNDAYRRFVRLIGGISDFTSAAAAVEMLTGDPLGALHPSILRITQMQRRSDQNEVKIINFTDIHKLSKADYGLVTPLKLDSTQGDVRYGVIGMQRGIIRWINVPAVDDVGDMMIYRLPFERITDNDQEFTDVDEDHHIHLLNGMKALAYMKQDAETFDKTKADDAEGAFEGYCKWVRAELERYKHKNREVAYGGI